MTQPTEITSVPQRTVGTYSTPSNVTAEELQSFKIADVVNRYVPPFIIVLGSTVNILAILVMRTRYFRTLSTSIYMIAGASNDVASLMISLLTHWLYVNFPHTIVRTSASHYMCKFFNFYGWGNCDYTIILTAAMTADRAFAIMYPLKTSATNMLRRAKIVVVVLAAVVVTKEFHFLFSSDIVPANRRDRMCDVKYETKSYEIFWLKVWPWLHVAYLVVCFIVILASNVIIICNVWRSAKMRDFRSGWRNGNAKKKTSVTLTGTEMSDTSTTCSCFRLRRGDGARGSDSGENSSVDDHPSSDQGGNSDSPGNSPCPSDTACMTSTQANGRVRKYLPKSRPPRRQEAASTGSPEAARFHCRNAQSLVQISRSVSSSMASVKLAPPKWRMCPCRWPWQCRQLLPGRHRNGNSPAGSAPPRWQSHRRSSAGTCTQSKRKALSRKLSTISQSLAGRRASAMSTATASPAQSKWRQMTTMLVAESLALVLLTFPFSLHMCLSMGISDLYSDPAKKAVNQLAFSVVFYLLYSNKVVNFCLYCASGSRFRQALREIFCQQVVEKHPTMASLAALDRSERLPSVPSFPLMERALHASRSNNASIRSTDSFRATAGQHLGACMELSVISSSRSGRISSLKEDEQACTGCSEVPICDPGCRCSLHRAFDAADDVSPDGSALPEGVWRGEGRGTVSEGDIPSRTETELPPRFLSEDEDVDRSRPEKSTACPRHVCRLVDPVHLPSPDHFDSHSCTDTQRDASCVDRDDVNDVDDDDDDSNSDGSERYISFVSGSAFDNLPEQLQNGIVGEASEEDHGSLEKGVLCRELTDQDNYVVFRALSQKHAPILPVFTLIAPLAAGSSSDRLSPSGCLP